MCENDYIAVYVSLAGERTTMGTCIFCRSENGYMDVRLSFAGARTTIIMDDGRASVAGAITTIWTCICCRCENDYVDVYAQLQHEDEDLLEAELTERFCGESMDNLPKLIVSTNNLLVLSFFTNSHKGNRGFQGSFEFFDDCEYNTSCVDILVQLAVTCC